MLTDSWVFLLVTASRSLQWMKTEKRCGCKWHPEQSPGTKGWKHLGWLWGVQQPWHKERHSPSPAGRRGQRWLRCPSPGTRPRYTRIVLCS